MQNDAFENFNPEDFLQLAKELEKFLKIFNIFHDFLGKIYVNYLVKLKLH